MTLWRISFFFFASLKRGKGFLNKGREGDGWFFSIEIIGVPSLIFVCGGFKEYAKDMSFFLSSVSLVVVVRNWAGASLYGFGFGGKKYGLTVFRLRDCVFDMYVCVFHMCVCVCVSPFVGPRDFFIYFFVIDSLSLFRQ